MKNKLNVTINIDGAAILHFSSFKLEQKFNSHHKFELRFNHKINDMAMQVSLDSYRSYIGKNINVQFGTAGSKEQTFVGKVTRVDFTHSHGYNGDIIVSGFSPTILLERGPDLGSYLNKDLKSIAGQVTNNIPLNDLKLNINPEKHDPVDYIIQYRESDFEFLNRLSAEYFEWFFYDGTELNFGKPASLSDVNLIYGRNLQQMQYGLNTAPLKYTRFAYQSEMDEMITADGQGASTGGSDLSGAIGASNQMYGKSYMQPAPIRINSQKDLMQYVQNEQRALISNLMTVSGGSDEPLLSIGAIADISMSMKVGADFVVRDFGKFLVTSVFHYIDGLEHYYNTFEGVSADTERLPVTTARKPQPDMQMATVIDNDDPEKLGRIKVQFKWQCGVNDPTEWLRIVTPNAGSDDQGSINRGFFAIPEKNDQVFVGFEEGNIGRPIIMGSVYHSRNGNSQRQVDNHIKTMSTRSGHLIEFNDGDSQGITITDRHNNQIHIDTQGNNITITALETMTLNSRNMQINVQQNMNVSVGANMKTGIGGNATTQVGKNSNNSVTMDYTMVANNIMEEATENMTAGAGSITKTASGDITVSSANGNVIHNASQEIHNKSGGKGKLF